MEINGNMKTKQYETGEPKAVGDFCTWLRGWEVVLITIIDK